MEIEKIKGYLAELETLQVYQRKIRKAIETGLETDLTALIQFSFIKLNAPAPEPIRKIYDSFNKEIDVSEFPVFMQKQPWLMFPGAKIVEIPQNDAELKFDIEAKSELLMFFLSYLLKRVEARIADVQNILTRK